MKLLVAVWLFVFCLCTVIFPAATADCRYERQQCSPRAACCEGLACAPMFVDEENPQLFYGNCLRPVATALSNSGQSRSDRPDRPDRIDRPEAKIVHPLIRDRQG
ncbi:uncharacterized protein LOC144178217 [Haemaphysalis longicornis]